MLIEATRAPVRSNLHETTQFNVHDAAKLFSILANLYADPLMSVVRELICNAWDAGGFVRVVLPSPTNPYFTVEDFGPGMDEGFMLTRYVAAGYSSKADTNDQIGGFGLGRLSALSVTDNYVITTQGKTYLVSLNERQVPQIVLADGSGEGTGTSVRVPIKGSDRSTLIQKVTEFLSWADPKTFEVIGANVEGRERLFETESCMVLAKPATVTKNYYSSPRHYVMLGPIAYEFDPTKIGGDVGDLPATVVMKFNIGELDLPPNRETITYTEKSIAAIRAKFDKVSSELSPLIFNHIRNLPARERLISIKQMSPMKNFHNKWMVSSGKRAEDKHTLVTSEHKWGMFIERELECVTIPGFYRTYNKGWRATKIRKVDKQGHNFVISSSAQLDHHHYFYADDKAEGSVLRYIEEFDGTVVIFSTDEDVNKIIDLKCQPLSSLSVAPRAPKDRSPPKVWDLADDPATLNDGDVWFEYGETLPYPRPGNIKLLGKAAQRRYLNDTHVHYSVWRDQTIEALKNDPRRIPFLRARLSAYPHYWATFFDRFPDLFPSATREHNVFTDAHSWRPDYMDLLDTDEPDLQPFEFPELTKVISKNPMLDAWVRTRFNGPIDSIDPTIFLTTKD